MDKKKGSDEARMVEDNDHQNPLPLKRHASLPPQREKKTRTECCLGRCSICKSLGLLHEPCAYCETASNESMEIIPRIMPSSYGTLDFSKYGQCFQCDKIGFLNRPCGDGCLDMVYEALSGKASFNLWRQKIFPPCALLKFSSCKLCQSVAHKLSKMFSQEVNMASSILETVRAYESMVKVGKVYKTEEGTFQHLFAPGEYHHYAPEKLISLIQHHGKTCLCSICKWVIVTDLVKVHLE